MSYQDRELTCVECGQPFTFSVEDQEYHAQRGYTNEPKRCPSCRAARRTERGGGGGGGYAGGGSGGGYSGGRQLYDVVCDSCGQPTQVPFQPRGDRPVYCSNCFSQQRSQQTAGSGGYGRSGGGRRDGYGGGGGGGGRGRRY